MDAMAPNMMSVQAPPDLDAGLMDRIRSGDRDAFADLVERHKDAVVNYLTRLTGNRDRAEDLAHRNPISAYDGLVLEGAVVGTVLRGARSAAGDGRLLERTHA